MYIEDSHFDFDDINEKKYRSNTKVKQHQSVTQIYIHTPYFYDETDPKS